MRSITQRVSFRVAPLRHVTAVPCCVVPVVSSVRTFAGLQLKFRPLSPSFGAEVAGATVFDKSITPVEREQQMRAIRSALVKHSVLLLRGVTNCEENQLVEFSRYLGPLELPPASEIARREASGDKKAKEIWVISNVKDPKTGQAVGALGYGEAEWHTDMSYISIPPMASVLLSREVPPATAGGSTSFASMFAAYSALPPHLLAAIQNRTAKHDATYMSTGELRQGFKVESDVRKTPGAVHPMIRTHPESGQKALFLGRRTNGYINGYSVAESDTILDALWKHATQPEFVYNHTWQVGDLLLWDNRSTIHKRESFDNSYRRYMLRTQIAGDIPK